MSRKLQEGVIQGVCQLMSETEVPELFSLWGGVVSVSAALGRNCFIDQGHFTVYPNIYVVLVAGSAQCRKSTIINTIEDLIRALETPVNMLSQKSTPEALIGALSGSIDDKSAKVVSLATGVAVVDELSTLIDKNSFNSGMISILTKLYDCKDFDYRTRGRGLETIRNPCLTIFGGSTIHWIKESIPVVSIGGGFTARIVFVFQDEKKQYVPWPKRNQETLELFDDIVHDLNHIHDHLRGRFAVTSDAIDLYSNEYISFSEKSDLFADPNMSGYAGRRHAIVLKLAMCYSASIKDSREIDEIDMARAITTLASAEERMRKVLSAINSQECGDLSEELVKFIFRKKRVSRTDLIRQYRNRLTGRELDVLLTDLLDARYLTQETEKGVLVYVWTGGK